MDSLIVLTSDFKSKFVKWFNNRYGWFFTNGYKANYKSANKDISGF